MSIESLVHLTDFQSPLSARFSSSSFLHTKNHFIVSRFATKKVRENEELRKSPEREGHNNNREIENRIEKFCSGRTIVIESHTQHD